MNPEATIDRRILIRRALGGIFGLAAVGAGVDLVSTAGAYNAVERI